MWKFLVKKQSIEILEREVLADHQIQYVQFKFTFDGDWKRFHKVVQFSQCDEVYSIVLGVDGTSCYLPAELHVGAARMSVFGYDTGSDTTVRATTVPVTLNIRHSGFVGDDEPPIPPTPDLYAQLLKKIEEAGHGQDGKSAYEIAVEHGYVGTETEWLASLHGADGQNGRNGTNGRNGADGADGKSAYQVAVEHGYVGTEAEWLESLKGKDGVTPDMSEYPKTTEVTFLIQQEIAPVADEAHTHANKAVLDSLTAALVEDLQGLQQFEDITQYDIQTIHEELLTLNAQRHTHENKTVLDSITEQYMQNQAAFQASTASTLHGLSTGLSEVSAQAHSHANKAVLDSITQEMLDDIASISTVVEQAHWHHNMTVLNGITESHVTRWNEAHTAAMNLNERVGGNEGIFERVKTEIFHDMQGCRATISDTLTRLSAVETELSGVEEALAAIVEVTT